MQKISPEKTEWHSRQIIIMIQRESVCVWVNREREIYNVGEWEREDIEHKRNIAEQKII